MILYKYNKSRKRETNKRKGLRKMKRNLMKEAHKMTREIVEKYGDVDYRTRAFTGYRGI